MADQRNTTAVTVLTPPEREKEYTATVPGGRYDSVLLICPREKTSSYGEPLSPPHRSERHCSLILLNHAKLIRGAFAIHWLHDISVLKLIIGLGESLLHRRKLLNARPIIHLLQLYKRLCEKNDPNILQEICSQILITRLSNKNTALTTLWRIIVSCTILHTHYSSCLPTTTYSERFMTRLY